MTNTRMRDQPHPPTKPIEVSADIVIDAPIETVYAFLSDVRHNPDWNRAITATDAMFPGPITRGSRYVQTRTVPRRSREIIEITAYEPPRLFELVSDADGIAVRYRYEFHALTEARTRVEMVVTLQPDHPVGRRDFYRARLARIMASNLIHLRAAIVASERIRILA